MLLMSKPVIIMENSLYYTNKSNRFYILELSIYIALVRLLLLCDSGFIHYLKLKSWDKKFIYTQMIR